jgi:hypothetical protein
MSCVERADAFVAGSVNSRERANYRFATPRRLFPMKTILVSCVLAVVFLAAIPTQVLANPAVFHLHNTPIVSPAGFVMDETAPNPSDPAQAVVASATFYGPATASTMVVQLGTYNYLIFGLGIGVPNTSDASVTVEVFRSSTTSLESIPGIAPQPIHGGLCSPNCVNSNSGGWSVSSAVLLNPGDRIALVIVREPKLENVFKTLVDGSYVDGGNSIATDSTLTVPQIDPPAVGGVVLDMTPFHSLTWWVTSSLVFALLLAVAALLIRTRRRFNNAAFVSFTPSGRPLQQRQLCSQSV